MRRDGLVIGIVAIATILLVIIMYGGLYYSVVKMYEGSTKEYGTVEILDKYKKSSSGSTVYVGSTFIRTGGSSKYKVKYLYKGVEAVENVSYNEYQQIVIGESYYAELTISKEGYILDMNFVKEDGTDGSKE